MFDFGLLTLPIMSVVALLGYGIYNGPEIVIEPIKVTHALEDQGYTSDVVTRHVSDEIRRISRLADSTIRSVKVDFDQADRSYNALTDYFEITRLVDAMRQTVGLVPYYFAGEMVAIGNEVEFRMRAYSSKGKVREFAHRAPIDRVDKVISSASFDMLKVMDPYIAGLYIRRLEQREGSKDFPRTFGAIAYAATVMEPNEQHLVHNLWARTLLLAGRKEEALRVADATIGLKPDFPNGYYSKAVILVAMGRPDEAAVEFERSLTLNPRANEVYVDYAKMLDAKGKRDEAAALLRRGLLVIPTASDVHHALGKILIAQGKRDEALVAFRNAIANTDRNQEYFEDYKVAMQSAGGGS